MSAGADARAFLVRWRWLLLFILCSLVIRFTVTPFEAITAPVNVPLARGWTLSPDMVLTPGDGQVTFHAGQTPGRGHTPATATRRLSVSDDATFIELSACTAGGGSQGAELLLASVRRGALDFNRQYAVYGFSALAGGDCILDQIPRRSEDRAAYLQLQLTNVAATAQLASLRVVELRQTPLWSVLRQVALPLGLLLLLWPFRSYLRGRPRWRVLLGLGSLGAILLGCLVSAPLKADIYALLTGGRELAFPADPEALLRTAFPIGGFSLFSFGHAGLFASAGLFLVPLAPIARQGWLDLMLLGVATETLQIFVPGRGPGVTDVALDWSGLLAAALLLFFFGVSQRVGLLLKK
jgi:hypothetical protein